MPITQHNNVTMDNLTLLSNVSSLPEFVAKVNHFVYDGKMVFFLLCAAWLILFIAVQRRENQPLNNMLYVSATVSVIMFFFRFVVFTIEGAVVALISDTQLYIFPIATAVLAVIIWKSDD
jgi:hypothetical protein